MMRSKKSFKLLVSLLVLVMVMTSAVFTVSAATTAVTLTGGNVNIGEEIDVPLAITGNVQVLIATITYDATALEYKSYTASPLLDSAAIKSVDATTGQIMIAFNAPTDLSGTCLTMKFKAIATEPVDKTVSIAVSGLLPVADAVVNNATVSIKQPVQSVTVAPKTLELKPNKTSTLTTTVLPTNASNKAIVWKSSDETVATVSDGVVTTIKPGTATITATSDDSKDLADDKKITDTCVVTVVKEPVTSVTLSASTLAMDVDGTATLTATVKPDDATYPTVTWTTSDSAIATVVGGVVTAVAKGTATITATADGVSATCAVTVTKPIDSISIDIDDFTLENNGDTQQLNVVLDPEDASYDSIVWSSSNESVATVDPETGLVTAVGPGTATITVTVTLNGEEITETVTVTVSRTIGFTVYAGQKVSIPIVLDGCVDLAGLAASVVYDKELLTLNSISAPNGFLFIEGGYYPEKDPASFVITSQDGQNGSLTVVWTHFTATEAIEEDTLTYIGLEIREILNSKGETINATLPVHELTILPTPPLPGDVNLNGVVDMPDAILVLQYISGNTELSPRQLLAADVNGDGAIDTADAIIIMQRVLNNI